MKNRIHKLLGSMVLAGTLFQFPGCGMQDVTNGVADVIKASVTATTADIAGIFVESWLNTAFPTD